MRNLHHFIDMGHSLDHPDALLRVRSCIPKLQRPGGEVTRYPRHALWPRLLSSVLRHQRRITTQHNIVPRRKVAQLYESPAWSGMQRHDASDDSHQTPYCSILGLPSSKRWQRRSQPRVSPQLHSPRPLRKAQISSATFVVFNTGVRLVRLGTS